jgi:hypothetical protein
MKVFLLIILTMVLFGFQEQPKMHGTYTLEYDKKHQLLGCRITFDDSVYVKTFQDGRTSRGKIGYSKFKITIRKDNKEDAIEIDRREILKDTIAFTTKSQRDASMSLNRGKLIKTK